MVDSKEEVEEVSIIPFKIEKEIKKRAWKKRNYAKKGKIWLAYQN
jgi:hypothetical protein